MVRFTTMPFRWLLLCLVYSTNLHGEASPREITSRLFERLAGVPLSLGDSRRPSMEASVAAGDLLGAAAVASADKNFYNLTIRQFATPMMYRDKNPQAGLNDGIATIIGLVRDYAPDSMDFRKVLTGDFHYEGSGNNVRPYSLADNNHYDDLDKNSADLFSVLVKRPQTLPETAGVLTLRAWGQAHLDAGTNRRATEQMFDEFACRKMITMADTSAPQDRVRRDVSRSPGGVPATFSNTCAGCHPGMDGLDGAWAHFDFVNGTLRHAQDGGDNTNVFDAAGVAIKMNRLATVYPDGFVTLDNSFVNYWAGNASMGWRGNTTGGAGVNDLGALFANSKGFSQCMAKKAFRTLCFRDFTPDEAPLVARLGDDFEQDKYNLKRLFEKVAILPECIRKH